MAVVPRGLTLTGGVSHGEPSPGVLDAFVARGIPHELLTPEAAHERWPGSVRGHVLHETQTAGRLHADRAVEAFCRPRRRRSVPTCGTSAGPVRRPGTRRRAVVRPRRAVPRRRVVLAVGAWTSALLGVPARRRSWSRRSSPRTSPCTGRPAATLAVFTHGPPGDHPVAQRRLRLGHPRRGHQGRFHAVGPVPTRPAHVHRPSRHSCGAA